MKNDAAENDGKVEDIGRASRDRSISKELERLIEPIHAEFPHAVSISFEFQKALQLHIDLRSLEEARVAETRLPAFCGGIFSQIFCGSSPHHPFFHRVSAKVHR
ncbi:hypothetical protein [Aurantiacibacter hainanensis]|uniref:hypothetical protein n=1 Tax=Aurantiacibacter hainanensis TaxID=3076114 RepID=UPI0030C6B25E